MEQAVINRNMELKARYLDLESAARILDSMGGDYIDTLTQIDTHFPCKNGHLKLREISYHNARETEAQLIWYQRPELTGIRASNSIISAITEPATFKEAMRSSLGVLTEVQKKRELYIWKTVRVYLDQVTGVGRFIEFVSSVQSGEQDSVGSQRLQTLCHHLQIPTTDYVAQSYADLQGR
ncbi:MAG: class IV adenylate cyclase [Phycisphaerales bacterium]|nr:class IV adenylate cyclase [Phycisphaerales bacterium]